MRGLLDRRLILGLGLVLCAGGCLAQQAQQAAEPAAAPPTATEPAPAADPYANMPPSEALADTLHARGRYLAAIRTYEALPPTTHIENKLGIACMHMMMYDKARESFEAALKIDPKSSEAYNNLGTLAHSRGDWSRAEKMYNKSLKLRPASANTWQNLGTLYYAEQKYKKGDAAYKKALAIDPDILQASRNRGIAAQSKANSVSEIHYHLAMTYAQAGSKDLALQYLRQAIVEGFHDRNRLLHDKEFGELRTSEAFLRMVDDLKNN
jgi:tetratricopeptide (TPR) repeat protein